MILNKKQIRELILEKNMVSNLVDMEVQLQPVSLDLTVKKIFKFDGAGVLDFDNLKRQESEKHEIPVDPTGKYYLRQGVYQVEVNEFFRIPKNIRGKTISRSSAQRNAAAIHSGYFDPGFIGTGMCLLIVYNEWGMDVYVDARVCQIEFQTMDETEGYTGKYQEE